MRHGRPTHPSLNDRTTRSATANTTSGTHASHTKQGNCWRARLNDLRANYG
jgi:hypothetical protein